jgi:hypothetical protein
MLPDQRVDSLSKAVWNYLLSEAAGNMPNLPPTFITETVADFPIAIRK